MSGIDSLLELVVRQGADELRMGTDEVPKMLRAGEPQRLALPMTSDATLRQLLGELLTPVRQAELGRGETVRFEHRSRDGTSFLVSLRFKAGQAGPLGVTFVRPPKGGASVSAVESTTGPAPTAVTAESSAPRAHPSDELGALLREAVSRGASDVHLRDGAVPALRVDGALLRLADRPPVALGPWLDGLLSAAEQQRVADGRARDLTFELPELGCFRLNVYRARDTTAAAIRILPRFPPSLESLGLPVPLDDVVELPHGLVLVCGPTGSGKSTTLAALADQAVRRRPLLLITLEDPIEYEIGTGSGPGLVRQRQVGRDVVDFPTGLRDALREDPDVLLIGEMRDSESISLALTAAETGHLVLASLHSRSASSAIERIADSYPPERQRQIRGQLADALRVVVSQRLLPRAQGKGRVAALEVLRVNHGVASAIRDGNSSAIVSVMQSARREGMIPLERALADLVRRGEVTRQAASAATNDPSVLEQYLAS